MKINLLYLSALTFILISTSAISMNQTNKQIISPAIPKLKIRAYTNIPILKDDAKYPVISAESAMAVDLNSGVYLYEKDPQRPLLPASTTKIITALVALDTYQLDQVLMVGNVDVIGQKMGLVTGEQITFRNLLDGLLVYSSNDAAEVLAQNFPSGREMFIYQMNNKAKEMGLKNTHFANPTGLDDATQFSTTKDLIVISKIAMRNPIFAEVVGTKEKIVKSIDGRFTHNLVNINKLLGNVEGVLGVKTGWTENARENLVTYIERGDKKIMIAVLGSQDRFGETKELIDWIFESFIWQDVNPSITYSP